MIIQLRSAGWAGCSMTDLDPLAYSEQLWGFINLQIVGDAAKLGRNKFKNVESLNGLEVWRRLVVPLESRSLSTRHGLHQLVQQPARAKTLDGVMDALEVWDGNLTKYVTAGGPEMIGAKRSEWL